ncbi:MAG: LysR family transcriptional regulator [Bdellovibrio sp.]
MTDLNYLHLYYFWTAANERGFSKASKRLEMSQSAISLQIQSLEKNLGKRLIDRSPKSFELTPEGVVAKNYCDDIFSGGESLVRALSGTESPSQDLIRLGLTWDFPVDSIQKVLQPRWRASRDSFKIESGSLNELIPQLLERKLDVVYSNTRPSQNTERKLMIRELQSSALTVAESFKRRHSRKGDLGTLEKTPFFVLSASLLKQSSVAKWLAKQDQPLATQEVTCAHTLKDFLMTTPGSKGLIPMAFIKTAAQEGDFKIHHEFKDLKFSTFAIGRNGSEKTARLRSFFG